MKKAKLFTPKSFNQMVEADPNHEPFRICQINSSRRTFVFSLGSGFLLGVAQALIGPASAFGSGPNTLGPMGAETQLGFFSDGRGFR